MSQPEPGRVAEENPLDGNPGHFGSNHEGTSPFMIGVRNRLRGKGSFNIRDEADREKVKWAYSRNRASRGKSVRGTGTSGRRRRRGRGGPSFVKPSVK